jgi:methylenetetrahydrofolate reductase (NADPH)
MHISFEYFPPKTDQGMASLIHTTNTLKQFNPEFFSVTYGAGGSVQNHTLTTVTLLQKQCDIKAEGF